MRNKRKQRFWKFKLKKTFKLKPFYRSGNIRSNFRWLKVISWYNKRFYRREKIKRYWKNVRLNWNEQLLWQRILYSKSFIKVFYYKYFLKKLLGSFTKCGKKQMIVKNFFKIFLLIKKFWKKSLSSFFNVLFLNLRPVLFLRVKHMGRTPYQLPWAYALLEKKKYNKVAIGWIKKTLKIRKEKTLVLRLFSELKDIYLNKGVTIRQKKLLYYNLYKARSTLRFLRFLQW